MVKKEVRQTKLVEILQNGSCSKKDLLKRLKISERTLWRDKDELKDKGYLIYIGDECELKSTAYQHDIKPASPRDIRWLAILKMVAETAVTTEEIKSRITYNEGCADATVADDINKLIQKNYLELRDQKLFLGDAMLEGLDLSQQEGSRLLSHLLIKQEIDGHPPLYNNLIPAVINLVGKTNKHFAWQDAKQIKNSVVIKGANQKQELREQTMADRLEQASWEERVVELTYKGQLRQVEPLGVIYSHQQDAWYLHAFCRKAQSRRTFRLEFVDAFEVLDLKFSYPKDFSLEEEFTTSWGIMVDEKPTEVLVKFYDDFNVLSRLKRETTTRKTAKLTPCENGSILYKDQIMGLEEFKVWVRSFGSSAEVLEPKKLREDLIDSVKAALALYGEVG